MVKNKKVIIKILNILILFVVMMFVNVSFASSYTATSTQNGYEITNYDVTIYVNEDNSYSITENIIAWFSSSATKHGIIRTIPLKNTVRRTDGSTETNHAAVSNVQVNDEFITSKKNGNYQIKIGSSSKTVSGAKRYIIKYNYTTGNDKNENFDELYFNIIGNKWDTYISNITFTIIMPKKFDSSKLGFSSGTYGSYNSSNITYNVEGNTITGSYTGNSGTLSPYQAITVRMELPEGYFTKQALSFTFLDIILFALPTIFIIIAIILWSKYGKDVKPVKTVEFYPPVGLNSLDVGYFYKGNVQSNHVISLLVYLANKGYLKIDEIEKSGIFSKQKTFVITKLKSYDGGIETEERFFNGLFACGTNNTVTEADLKETFYLTINKVKASEKSLYEKKIYQPQANKMMLITGIMTAIIFSLAFLKMVKIVEEDYITEAENVLNIIECLYLIASSIVLGIFTAIMKNRSPYGTEILGKIQGFRDFLQTAEKEKLERLCEENPTYFYDILPYTYALDVSKVWMKKFESMAIEPPPPTWYNGGEAFRIATFNSFMDRTMTHATSAMISTPSSSSSGGGFSGGGFSGGGSGGGGGSSW